MSLVSFDRRLLSLSGLVVACICSFGAATGEDIEAERAQAAMQSATTEVEKYRFLSDQDETAELHRQPVLKWSNPAAGSIHGNVFVWSLAGRPLVAGSLFQWFSPFTHSSHEFVSLATTPLSARYEGKTVWETKTPGVTLTPLADAPPPEAFPARRLVQMRSLVRGFSATKIDREGQQQELRLLSQPVYRYEAREAGPIDGALFAFVQGTDPEVWLMLEAHQRDGKRQWHFAAAPMNSVGFLLHRAGTEVWRVDIRPWAEVQSHRETYTSFRFGELVR